MLHLSDCIRFIGFSSRLVWLLWGLLLLIVPRHLAAQPTSIAQTADSTSNVVLSDTVISSLAYIQVLRNSLNASREWTYIISGLNNGRWFGEYFEANIAPEYLVRLDLKANRKYALLLKLVPQVQFRMFDEESAPIRTPSFIPTFHLHFVPNMRKEDSGDWTWVLTGTAAHHSNGSSGTFFDSVQVPGQPPRLNRRDGNFSANYLGLAMQRYRYFHRSNPARRAQFVAWHLRGNYYGGIRGSALEYEPGLENTYGRIRTLASVRYYTELGRLREPVATRPNRRLRNELGMDLQVGWIWDRQLEQFGSSNLERRMHVRGQFVYKPYTFYETSIIAQVFWGHDYYNIRFSDQVFSFRIGLEASIEPFLLRLPRPTVLNRRLKRVLSGSSADWDKE